MAKPPSLPPGADGPIEPLLISARRAEQVLDLSGRTLWALTKSGQIPHVRVNRRVLYSPAALRQWIAQRTKGGQS